MRGRLIGMDDAQVAAVAEARAPPLPVEFLCEVDGRWIGKIPSLPGVMRYGATREEALRATITLALEVIADRLEHGEPIPDAIRQAFSPSP